MIPAGSDYLATEVLTATPQKLQLMLIDGAIRLAHSARRHWQAGDPIAASGDLIQAQQIVNEMINGLDPRVHADLVRTVATVYLWIYQTLVKANLERSETQLDDALRVLNIERETWQMACNQSGQARAPHFSADALAPTASASFIA